MIVMSGKCDCDGCRIHTLLHEIGVVVIKQRCAALFDQGFSRDEINVALNERFIPEMNDWVDAQRECILQGFMDESSAGHTLN
jgi:hypothetical protein